MRTAIATDPPGDGPDWISTQDGAKHLGITTRQLYHLIDAGEVDAARPGRVIRLRRSSLDAYLERHPEGPPVDLSA